MIEDLCCKNRFTSLDQFNHEFVDIPDDSNCLYYQIGIILHELGVQDIPVNGINLAKFMQKTLKYFLSKKEKTSNKMFC